MLIMDADFPLQRESTFSEADWGKSKILWKEESKNMSRSFTSDASAVFYLTASRYINYKLIDFLYWWVFIGQVFNAYIGINDWSFNKMHPSLSFLMIPSTFCFLSSSFPMKLKTYGRELLFLIQNQLVFFSTTAHKHGNTQHATHERKSSDNVEKRGDVKFGEKCHNMSCHSKSRHKHFVSDTNIYTVFMCRSKRLGESEM